MSWVKLMGERPYPVLSRRKRGMLKIIERARTGDAHHKGASQEAEYPDRTSEPISEMLIISE